MSIQLDMSLNDEVPQIPWRSTNALARSCETFVMKLERFFLSFWRSSDFGLAKLKLTEEPCARSWEVARGFLDPSSNG